ncbi:hypothetical protein TanjilG_32410 [Lupinus angustifolius]|uniref:CRIB domain-containing protein RIC7-like n=1 Tax=Lupinus angustifolius TaxID=3871 RepID=UPI00090D4701|nr:PREDICTED: CRIB domain-containing protein RIC7-like [Lupinus angustifolius]OIV90533.1 hypothetical protein TanjilG_32410 [Lupinus angustifolius]
MSSKKVKGLLRGFKYISQIFENEKEEEIQIGNPTDVKHVAHIGWDGPSVNTPSWMNEFKSSPRHASTPLDLNGELQHIEQDNSVKWVSEVSRRGSRHVNARGSKVSTNNMTDSPTKEKANKTRQTRKSSKLKDSLDESNPTQQVIQLDAFQGDESSTNNSLDIPKKSRRKKLKDNSNFGESSKLRSKDQHTELESPPAFVSKPRHKQRFMEESGQYERGVSRIS